MTGSGDGGLRGDLEELLRAVAEQRVPVPEALGALAELPFRDLGFARVDTHRELRQGAPEAVLGEGKTIEEVLGITRALRDSGAGSVLVTRADAAMRDALAGLADGWEADARARCAWRVRALPEVRGHVAILMGGDPDAAAAHEARIRAELLGTAVVVHDTAQALDTADCVVVIADAALAGAAVRLTRAPVIGVPVSTGSAADSVAALRAMLGAASAGLAVVNVDDGFGAGTLAATIARRSHPASSR